MPSCGEFRYSIYSFPQTSITASTFLNSSPISLRLYSTFGGICWYSVRTIRPSFSADGLVTALPLGLRRIDALRTLTTEAKIERYPANQ